MRLTRSITCPLRPELVVSGHPEMQKNAQLARFRIYSYSRLLINTLIRLNKSFSYPIPIHVCVCVCVCIYIYVCIVQVNILDAWICQK